MSFRTNWRTREERYAEADSLFTTLISIDPLNESARQYKETIIPARVSRISKAEKLSGKARRAAELQQEGRVEEAKALWNEIILESKKELQK